MQHVESACSWLYFTGRGVVHYFQRKPQQAGAFLQQSAVRDNDEFAWQTQLRDLHTQVGADSGRLSGSERERT